MTIITAISLFQSCKPITGRNFPVSRRQTFILCGCRAIRQDAHLNFDVGFNLHKLAPRRGDGGTFWESYGDALLVDRAQRSTCRLFSLFFNLQGTGEKPLHPIQHGGSFAFQFSTKIASILFQNPSQEEQTLTDQLDKHVPSFHVFVRNFWITATLRLFQIKAATCLCP